MKNKDSMAAQPPQITKSEAKTYNMSSTVMVTLQKDDVRSQLTCEVRHSTLQVPLREMYQLSRVLRGEGWGLLLGCPTPVGLGSLGQEQGTLWATEPGTPNTKFCFSFQFPPVLKCALSRALLR